MAQSEVYFLATVLCPYYKLEWFVKQEDELARIEELRRILYRYFARTCPASASTMTTQTQPTTSASSRVSQPTSRWLQTPTRATRAVVPYTPGQEWVNRLPQLTRGQQRKCR
ncbi:unnamed protein product [Rhizoctonia solani]|uniref:Uncharacterized protein n=1 Tax=Rhizoctonia solani TaxID=456999 RepID=A0A8H2WP57_9AGAM|nr:unnamed protein product [Rhizoctonia solani]